MGLTQAYIIHEIPITCNQFVKLDCCAGAEAVIVALAEMGSDRASQEGTTLPESAHRINKTFPTSNTPSAPRNCAK